MQLGPSFRTIFSLLFLATINTGIAQAQVIPDGTLPSVVEKLGNMDKITGGERVGNNLFHSFEEFSIKEGMEAIFENALDIENIFARITGSEISLIEGLLKTSGGANLFLMNPNGIVLAGGSININASESLSLKGRVANIRSNIRSETFGTGEGANINISANQLLLQDGARIRSNSFSSSVGGKGGNIDINVSDLTNLSNSSIIATTFDQGDGGTLSLSTSTIKLNVAGVSSSTFGEGNGGNLIIDADLIEISGSSPRDRASVSTTSFGNGNAGDLNLNASQLRISGGASLSSSSFGNGNAGDLNLNASQLLELRGKNKNAPSSNNPQSTIRAAVQSVSPQARKALGLPEVPSGNAGNLIINTPLLNVTQQGVISVENQGSGSAGTLTINAANLNLDESGSITAAAESGLGGNLELKTQNLNISNDSQITSAANGNENGGNITINTQNLTAKKNTEITANAFEGDGGNIAINADSVSLNDNDEITARSELGDGGNIEINSERIQLDNSVISASAGGEGNGGNVTINTDIFTAFNNSRVTANAVRGEGGNITINTDGYFVSDDFVVSASSEFGLDGTVNINVDDENLNESFILPDYPLISLQEILAKSCLTKKGRISNSTRINSLGRGALPISPSTGIDLGEDIPMQKVHVYSERDWQPGEPLIQVEKLITTGDGKRLGVAEVEIPKRCLH